MELRILPSNISNLIAAGEVIQRPASVVKELVENAVDAGATQIDVVISDSGRTLIQVIDNGSGMTPDDAVLCFERHATSKIAEAEDLEKINTFGFRGEALASIAAVAEVSLKTRRAENETGCEVEFAASRQLSTSEISTPKGTNISVRNLFYNVPARRKFLKSDNIEFKHIAEEFLKVALTNPNISFTLTHNSREIYVAKVVKSLKFRILNLFGNAVASDLVDISAQTSLISLKGFIGKPENAKKTVANQYFFVRGRYFRSAYLHKAVMNAYENLIVEGASPTYFIYLEIDPRSVDVNISPNKSEVKFEDESFVFQVVYATIKEAIGKNGFAESIDFSNPEAKDFPVFGKNFSEYMDTSAPKVDFDANFNPFENENMGGSSPEHFDTSRFVTKRDDYGKLFEDNVLPTNQVMIVDGRFILSQAKNGLMVVNVKRAMERILYDRFLSALTKNEHATQATMFPVKVTVGVDGMALFEDNAETLTSLGFDITPFGVDTIVVNGLPEGYPSDEGKILTMVSDIMLILSDQSESLPNLLQSSMAEKFALSGACNKGPLTSQSEARNILDALLSCSNAEFTNNGKKIINIVSISQVENLF